MTEQLRGVPAVRTADPALLLDLTRCPACFEPLRGTRCVHCGLDVSVDGGVEVYSASQAVVRALEERDRAIAAMRATQAAQERRRDAPPPEPASASPSVAAPPPSPPSADDARPRRSGVQVLLLVAGVTAISVAAICFALVAALLATPGQRAAILAVVGAAVLGGAVALRRRLPATAEAVTVVGLVVLLLDLLLLRTSDVLGLGTVDVLVYAGAGLAVVAAVGAALDRRAGLRAGSVAAAFLLPAAVLMVVAGLARVSGWATAIWLAALAAAAVAVVAGLAASRAPASVLLRTQALLAAVIALVAGITALGEPPLLRLVTEGAVAALAVGVLVVERRRGPGVAVDAAAAVAAAAITLALLLALGTGERPLVGGIALGPVALLIPLGCVVLLVRRARLIGRDPVIVGLAASGAIALPVVAATLAGAGRAVVALLVAAPDGPFPAAPGWATPVPAGELGVGLGGSALLLTVVAAAIRRRWAVVTAAVLLGAGAVTTAVATGSAGALLTVAVAVGGLAVAAAAVVGRRAALPASVVLAAAVAAIALVAPRSATLWPFAVIGGLVLLAVAAAIAEPGRVRAGVVAVLWAFLVVMLFALVPWAAAIGWAPLAGAPVGAVPFVVSGAILAAGGLLRGRAPDRERVTAVGVAVLGGLASGTVLAVGGHPGAPAAGALGLAAAAGGAGALARHRGGSRDPEPVPAALLGPILIVAATTSVAAAVPGAPTVSRPLAAAVGVLLAAGLAVTVVARRGPVPRCWESAAATAALATAVASFAGADAWIPLAVLAAAALVIALGEPERSRARRLAAAWAAFGLGVAALWDALAAGSADVVEPYTLPPAATLLAAVAVLALRRPSTSGRGPTALAAAGLALALGPSAITASLTSGPRSVVVASVAAALVLAAVPLPARIRGVRIDAALVGVGAPTLALVSSAESLRALHRGGLPEPWWIPAALVLLGTGALLARGGRWRVGAVAVAGGSTAVAVIVAGAGAGPVRVASMLTLLAVAHVVLVALPASRPAVAAVPIVAAGLAALAVLPVVRPIEAATVTVAAGLLAAGTLRMRREPALRSWPAVGAGLAVLLLPSLALDLVPSPTWRVVGLGAASLAVLLVGFATRTSAPFLLGGAVFVTHVLAQLWPWAAQLYVAVPWWAWMAAAGVLLLALGARYEQRVRNLKQAVRLLGAQR